MFLRFLRKSEENMAEVKTAEEAVTILVTGFPGAPQPGSNFS